MNRAILIVICDFIVSAMLSLFTGGNSVGTAGGTRGAALDNRTAVMVLQEMRREQAELEKLRKVCWMNSTGRVLPEIASGGLRN